MVDLISAVAWLTLLAAYVPWVIDELQSIFICAEKYRYVFGTEVGQLCFCWLIFLMFFKYFFSLALNENG